MAIAELVMPKLGESIMEATILKWHKQVGDPVSQDETVLDIATDKVDSEVPSTAEGVITEILFNINDVVPIGTVIARISIGGSLNGSETIQQPEVATTPEAVSPLHEPVVEEPVAEANSADNEQIETPTHIAEAYYANTDIPYTPAQTEQIERSEETTPELSDKPIGNRFYSPLVLNIANSEGIPLSELERITGTGNEGRVTKKDILQYVGDKKAGIVPAYATPVAVANTVTSPVAILTPASDVKPTSSGIVTASYTPAS
ncbi:MAG: biotin/lipoyl-containing protein, partial [Sediminibacterium sp.]